MGKPIINDSSRESARSLLGCVAFVAVGVWLALKGRRFGWVAAATGELYREWHDGEAITPEELAQLITLNSVTVWDEGSADLYYTAGDLFAGHWICAPLDAGGEIGEPDLEG